jgi:Ca2+-binding RTX toxin-like protein
VITTTGLKIAGTAANDTIQANDLGNKIYAKNGNDIVKGGAGADFIDGGAGLDSLFGGSGHDTFYFSSSNDAKGDSILDFVHGSDRIDLSKIDAVAGGATNDMFSFIEAGAFTKAGQLHFTQGTAKGVTYVEGNLDASPGAEFRIEVKGLHTFASGDFIL